MYHCSLRFQMVGRPCRAFEVIREMAPLERFTHAFTDTPANVFLVNLEGGDGVETLRQLSGRGEDTCLILLAQPGQVPQVLSALTPRDALWTMPMSDEEIRFRFGQWQAARKQEKDLWLSQKRMRLLSCSARS